MALRLLGISIVAVLAGLPRFSVAQAVPEQSAFAANLEVVDIPTATTLYGRMFHLNFRLFRGGGVLAKAMASFNNSLMLGLSLKADRVIGGGAVRFEDEPVQPLVKLRILSAPGSGLQLAMGYDGMASPETLDARMEESYIPDVSPPRGIYLSATKSLSFMSFHLRAHGGASVMQLRHFDSDRDINVFAGLDGALSEELSIGAEYDDILCRDGTVNAVVSYAWDVGLRMELDFLNLLKGMEAHHRALKILYTF